MEKGAIQEAVRDALAFAGLAGTLLLAYALFGNQPIRWKRLSLGFTGFALVAVFWTVHPTLSWVVDDGSSLADEWP